MSASAAQRKIYSGAGQRKRPGALRPCAHRRARTAHHPRYRQRHHSGQPGAPGTGGTAGFRGGGRSRRHLDVDCRHAARGDGRRLRPRHWPSSICRSARCPSSSSCRRSARQDLALLERMTVPGKHGPVMIGNVASLSLDSGPAEIDRYDRLRNINFEIELNQQPLGEVEQQALALPSLAQPAARRDCKPRSATPRRWANCSRSFGLAMADRRALHLHRAGAAVQGFRAAGDHSGRPGAVGARRLPGAVRHAVRRCRCRR